jgi:heavy metal sensor kinase
MMSSIVKSVRLKLTLWHSAVLFFLILIFSLTLYHFVDSRLNRGIRDEAEKDLSFIEQILREDPDELGESGSEMPALMFKVRNQENGTVRSQGWDRAGLDGLTGLMEGEGAARDAQVHGRHFLWMRKRLTVSVREWTIEVAVNAESAHQSMKTLRLFLLVGAPFALLLSLFSGYFLALKLLKPIDSMASKAKDITADHLDQRLPIVNPEDEFGRLAHVFNQTLERLQSSFESLRRFTSDASHELRTPLTAMRSVGEVALRRPLNEAGYRDAIGSMLEEVGRLSELVENLLTLTRNDQVEMKPETFPLGILAGETVDDLKALAEEKHQKITVETQADCRVSADRPSLRQAMIGILDNAVKYTPEGGNILVRVRKTADWYAVFEVEDTGCGIPKEHLDKIFERFYRVDAGRSRETGGYGLGLAIAQQAVQKNGGRIEVESESGQGCVFRILLPAETGDRRS